MTDFVAVAKVGKLKPGSMMTVKAHGAEVALYNVGGQIYATDDVCSHAGGSLSEGELEGHVVTCPLHGSQFDVRTGEAVGPPADEPVSRYQVKVEGEDILVAKT